jgi:lysozyme
MNAINPQVIDLSHHNTVLSLHDAAASGIVGVIHKATDGLHYVDPKCADRFALTRDAGMLWGIYHFLRPYNIEAQARSFLAQKNLIDEKTLLALDFEVNGISEDDLAVWLGYVEAHTGQRPVIYSGSYLKALKGQERLSGYRLWLAQYSKKAVLPKGFDDYFLWQYSDSGEVPGIKGPCDVNVSRLTDAELKQNWTQTVPADSTHKPAPDLSVTSADELATTQKPAPAPADKESKPPPAPQTVTKETPSTFVKWVTAIKLAIGGVLASATAWCGSNEVAQTITQKGAEKAIENADRPFLVQLGIVVLYMILGIGAGVFLMWVAAKFYDNSAERANKLNQQKAAIASDTEKATVEFTK